MVGRGCAWLDYDGDGRLDLVVTENNGRARLFRNETPNENNWVRVLLRTDDRDINREGIGAEIAIHTADGVQRRYVTPAHGYLSQSDLTAYFGLGQATGIDHITVRWPGRTGKSQEWRNLTGRRDLPLNQGRGGCGTTRSITQFV